jgi:hypothetical protein
VHTAADVGVATGVEHPVVLWAALTSGFTSVSACTSPRARIAVDPEGVAPREYRKLPIAVVRVRMQR